MPKADALKLTLLGTGTSTGVPVIGCHCRVCRSTDPRDNRMRCAALVEFDGVAILIDAGPDLRQQALRHGIEHVDAVLFTHHHFDHVAGMDDLRPFLFRDRSPIPCYANPETAAILRSMFGYIFVDGSYPGVANLALHEIGPGPLRVHSRRDPSRHVEVQPIPVHHGPTTVTGFRFGDIAYITDANAIPEPSFRLLEGVDTLVLDALRHEPHGTHFSIGEATSVARRIGARQSWFVHMTHSILHEETDGALPEGVSLAYDGLCLTGTGASDV